MTTLFALVLPLFAWSQSFPARASLDPRDIRNGLTIPDEGYCDQPYIVVRAEGGWVCTMTTGKGREGQPGQHVVSTISEDRGRTWSPLVDIEPADGPEASWAVPLVTPGGRVYVFYDYNGDRVRSRGETTPIRADMLGWYAYRYSDDGGRSWSRQRYRLPVRVTACDRANDWQGDVQIFWGICKPIISNQEVFFSFTKLGRYMLEDGEGWLFRSDNLLSARAPEDIRWTMLPAGEHGIRAPEFGSIQEEHNLVALSNGDLYCVYRTTTGYPCHTYSRDRGRTWSKPEPATYSAGGRKIKNPRACPKIWRASNGRYLLWFHNHSGRDFTGRNPAWISGGIERDGCIQWSQPEIVLYDREPDTRMSYPDLIEQDGRYWISETQKEIARIHEIDPALLAGLWTQGETHEDVRSGLVLECSPDSTTDVTMPALPDLRSGGGFSIDLRLRLQNRPSGTVLLDSRSGGSAGVVLTLTDQGAMSVELCDGRNTAAWECDGLLLKRNATNHVTVIVDGGPKIITFVVNGHLCDGGERRRSGWTHFDGAVGNVTGGNRLRIAPPTDGGLVRLRLYSRYLRTSEAVALATFAH